LRIAGRPASATSFNASERLMFLAEIWGTVADWFTFGATVAAAAIALGYYIYGSQHRKKAQARQIRARAIPEDQSTVSIEVRSDSERHISDIYFMYVEDSLTKVTSSQEPVRNT